jgi:hypothetical protein
MHRHFDLARFIIDRMSLFGRKVRSSYRETVAHRGGVSYPNLPFMIVGRSGRRCAFFGWTGISRHFHPRRIFMRNYLKAPACAVIFSAGFASLALAQTSSGDSMASHSSGSMSSGAMSGGSMSGDHSSGSMSNGSTSGGHPSSNSMSNGSMSNSPMSNGH